MNSANTMRPSGSLNSFPPETLGSTVYHTTYAGSSQKYTSGWPKYQKSMRASNGSTVLVHPSDQGINWSSISAATPTVEMSHTMMGASIPKTASGAGAPRASRPP